MWKIYSDGHLQALAPLPVLTDLNVRSAPVLASACIWVAGAIFDTGSAGVIR